MGCWGALSSLPFGSLHGPSACCDAASSRPAQGAAGKTSTAPLETVKMQLVQSHKLGTREAVQAIWRRGGLRAFFRRACAGCHGEGACPAMNWLLCCNLQADAAAGNPLLHAETRPVQASPACRRGNTVDVLRTIPSRRYRCSRLLLQGSCDAHSAAAARNTAVPRGQSIALPGARQFLQIMPCPYLPCAASS